MWANCVGWLVYSFLIRDAYVLASNVPGLVLAVSMTVTCYGFADEKACPCSLLFTALALPARARDREPAPAMRACVRWAELPRPVPPHPPEEAVACWGR
jgi:hypothetical protein